MTRRAQADLVHAMHFLCAGVEAQRAAFERCLNRQQRNLRSIREETPDRLCVVCEYRKSE